MSLFNTVRQLFSSCGKPNCPGFSWDRVVFLVPGTVLCFEFSMQRTSINTDVFSCCSVVFRLKSRIFQLLMPSQRESWRGTSSWEGTQPGHLTQTGQQGIPDHVTSCPVYKLGGVGLGGIAARELRGHWLASGEQRHCASLVLYIPILLLLLLPFYYCYYYHYQFLPFCSIKLFLSQPTSFTFFLLILPPIPLGGEDVSEQLRDAELLAAVKPQQRANV